MGGNRHPGSLRSHIAAPALCRPKLAPVTRCVPQDISGRRRDRKTSSASGTAEPFTPVSHSNRECQLAMLLLPRAFVYSDLREAISIEKRYLTSDLSSRS